MIGISGTSPRFLSRWDAVGMWVWTWTWRKHLLSADGLCCFLPDTLALDDSDTPGADSLTSSLTARRDTKARDAHWGWSRKPCWSLGVFGDSAAFPQMPHVFGHVCVWGGVAGASRGRDTCSGLCDLIWSLLEADLPRKSSSVY